MSTTTALPGAYDAQEPVAAPPELGSERAALAAELHDLVTHQATVVAVQLAAAETPSGQSRPGGYMPLTAATGVLDEMTEDLRRLGRLLADERRVPLEPVPSATALLARLAGEPGAEQVALRGVPAGVVVCAYRCLELLEDDGRASVTVATPSEDVLVLDAVFPGPADRLDLAARVRLRLSPCAGSLRVLAPDHWRLELPLKA